jgi:hypothetical protein
MSFIAPFTCWAAPLMRSLSMDTPRSAPCWRQQKERAGRAFGFPLTLS